MPAPRIEPADAPYAAPIAETFSRVTPPGKEPLKLFRTMARNPRILQRLFAGALLDAGSLSLHDRELVILRTCARCGSEYEWGVHVAFFASHAGLQPQQIAATLDSGSKDDWTVRDLLLVRLVDELHDSADVSDELWKALAEEFSDEQLLELVTLTGYYHTISFLTNALRVEKESYAPRFRDAGTLSAD